MRTSFYCYKSAIVLTFFLSFTVADALTISSVLDVSVGNYHCPPGASVQVEFTLNYNANPLGEMTNIYVEAYASSDTAITEGDFHLGSGVFGGRYKGSGSKTGGIAGKFPTDIPPGDYYVGIICSGLSDYDGSPVLIDPALAPDLIITSMWLPDSDNIIAGGSGRVNCTVENIGSYESGNFVVYLYVSEDSTITDDDCELGHLSFGSLYPGDKNSVTRGFRLPDDIPLGDYYIGGIVDCSNETNLENNSCCGDSFSVVEPVDISIQNVSVNLKHCICGGSINVTVTVENIERMSSDDYTVDYYASTNYTTTYFLGSLERSGLLSGETDTFDHLCQLPQDIPQGQYYIGVKLTCDNDTYEGNNEGWSNSITVGTSNLAVESVEAADGTYIVGDQITVYTLIKNTGDKVSDSYTVDYYASTDTVITTSDYHMGYANRSGLAPDEHHSFDTTCQMPFNIPAGNYYIGIIITCPEDYDQTNNTGFDNTVVEVLLPTGYVGGQIRYKDIYGGEHPLRYALIKVYEYDNNANPLDDHVIGQTYTNYNGNYGIILPEGDNNSQDIYVRVFTEGVSGAYLGTMSRLCDVRDDVFKESYFLESPHYPHPQDSSVVINITAPENGGAFMVYDAVIEGFHKAKMFFGIEMDEITTYWPCSEDETYYDPCDQKIFIAQDDRSDRDVILHEYGHYIAITYGIAIGSVGDNPIHYWDRDLRNSPVSRTAKEAVNLAFREAWPTLFSIATQYGDTWYPNSGDTKYQDYDEASKGTFEIDLEEDTSGHKSPGQYYENMNTCALWDIFDDHDGNADDNDTLSDITLEKIWTISRDYQPDDIIDFWNSWFQSYAYPNEMLRIFADHEMRFRNPLLPPTAEDFETGDFSMFDWTGDWLISSEVSHGGMYSARAGNIGNNQSSTMEVTLNCNSSTIIFWVKVSSEYRFDGLAFSIDGVKPNSNSSWTGQQDWTHVSHSVQTGTRTFTWTYRKDWAKAVGDDTAWIDDIQFPIK